MRATASGPMLNRKFFIIMDRLYQTLDLRIKDDWSKLYNKAKGGLFGMGANKQELQQLSIDRLVVAYDLSTAFQYMHENKYVNVAAVVRSFRTRSYETIGQPVIAGLSFLLCCYIFASLLIFSGLCTVI